jgi:HTH-type transcriptional regulator, sugar sensing transcriptional regulator
MRVKKRLHCVFSKKLKCGTSCLSHEGLCFLSKFFYNNIMREYELTQLGLSEKEAKVYLAVLELGASTVIAIAQKAGINRPTAYVQVESLMKKGLMSSLERGNRKYFLAEPPDRLQELVRNNQAKVDDQNNRLKEIMPELEGLFNTTLERPKVRFYEGKDGVFNMIADVLKDAKTEEILNFYSGDPSDSFFTEEQRAEIEEARKRRGIRSKSIYTRQSGPYDDPPPPSVEERYVPPEKFPFSGAIDIFDSKIVSHTMNGKIIGVIIENKAMAEMMRSLFKLAWESAEKYQ